MKKSSNGKKGGLLVGKTDKRGGKGIPAEVVSGKKVILGGGEGILKESAMKSKKKHLFNGKKKTPCEIADKLNTEAGGRSMNCHLVDEANTGRMDLGGAVSNDSSGSIVLLKNKEKAPKLGARFGQDVEPSGFYAIKKETTFFDGNPQYETVEINYDKALVIDVTNDTLVSWKYDLSKKEKAKGKFLTNKLLKKGYDIIITQYPEGDTGEIIVLDTSKLSPVKMSKGGKISTHVQYKSVVLETIGSNHYLRLNGESWKITDGELRELLVKLEPYDNPLTAANFLASMPKEKYEMVTVRYEEGGNLPDAKKTAEDFVKSLSPEILDKFKNAMNDFISTQEEGLKKLEVEKSELENKRTELYAEEKLSGYNREKTEERMLTSDKIRIVSLLINTQTNAVQAVKNGGDLATFTDKKGTLHENIPSFIKVDTQTINFKEETILADTKPAYIPVIDEESFRQKGYIFDAIRIAPDEYILAVNGYKEKKQVQNRFSLEKDEEYFPSSQEQGFCLLTLDQLVLTNDYYYTKAKATERKNAQGRNDRVSEAYYKLPLEKRQAFYAQRNFYNSLPAAVKKKYSQETWESLTLEQKQELYIPVKHYGSKRLVSKLDEQHMWVSFHNMYERFLNPLAVHPKPGYANPEVWAYWKSFSEMMKWKINDIKIQREIENENYKVAIETSFGESNTNDTLVAEYGILVKRQNGDAINISEISQIEDAWKMIEQKFGSLKDMALSVGLKISHTGQRLVFASKAAGMYIPKMKTISVSAKFGAQQFANIMAHETAHFMDNMLGDDTGKRYLTDNYETLAGKIAIRLRKGMNVQTESDYINATKECFARALEQYFAIETHGPDAELVASTEETAIRTYFTADAYVSPSIYAELKPMIEEFLSSVMIKKAESSLFGLKEIRESFGDNAFSLAKKQIENGIPTNLKRVALNATKNIDLGEKDSAVAVAEALQYEFGYADNWADLRSAIKKGGIELNKEAVDRMIAVGIELPADILEKNKQREMKKEFTFLSDNPKNQARAITVLSKRINNDGNIMPIYEMIEGFEPNLVVETAKIHSTKSEKGSTDKLVIGDHIMRYKAEQDYYKYIQDGGYPLTKWMEDKKSEASLKAIQEKAEQEVWKKKREEEAAVARAGYEKAKKEQIKELIEKGADFVIKKRVKGFEDKIKALESARKSEANKQEIDRNKMYIEQAKNQIDHNYEVATQLYHIDNGEVVPKFSWKEGDTVMVDGQDKEFRPIKVATKIVKIKFITTDGKPTYEVEKAEGFSNPNFSYDGLFPVNSTGIKTGISEEQEHLDTLNKVAAGKITPNEALVEIAETHLEQNPMAYSKFKVGDTVKYKDQNGDFALTSTIKEVVPPRPENGEPLETYALEAGGIYTADELMGGDGKQELSHNAEYHFKMINEMYPKLITVDTTKPSQDLNMAIDELEKLGLIKRISYKNGFAEYAPAIKIVDYSNLVSFKRESVSIIEAFQGLNGVKILKFEWNGKFYEVRWVGYDIETSNDIKVSTYSSKESLLKPLSVSGKHETIYNTFNADQQTPEGKYIVESLGSWNLKEFFKAEKQPSDIPEQDKIYLTKRINHFNEKLKENPKDKESKDIIGIALSDYWTNIVSKKPQELADFLNIQMQLPSSLRFMLNWSIDVETNEDFIKNLTTNIWKLIPEELKQYKLPKRVNYSPVHDNEGLVKIIKPFVNHDALRINLMGVNFDKNGITATDAHKLIFLSHYDENREKNIYCIENDCLKNNSNQEVVVDVKYPNYEAIIPKNNHFVSIYTESLIAYLETIINVKYFNNILKQCFITFDSESEFSFNSMFLLEAAEAMYKLGYDQIDISYSMPNKAVILCPKGKVKDVHKLKTDFVLIMPIMIGNEIGFSDGIMYFNAESECVQTKGIEDSDCLNPIQIVNNKLDEKIKKVEKIQSSILAEKEQKANEEIAIQEIADELMSIDANIWDKLKIQVGDDLYSDLILQRKYVSELNEATSKFIYPLSMKVHDILEAENQSSLNQYLYLSGAFGEKEKQKWLKFLSNLKTESKQLFLDEKAFLPEIPKSIFNIGDEGMWHGAERKVNGFDELGNVVLDNGTKVSIPQFDSEFAKFPDKKINNEEWLEAISTLEMLIDLGGSKAELAEWKEAVETLKMLLDPEVMAKGGRVNEVGASDSIKEGDIVIIPPPHYDRSLRREAKVNYITTNETSKNHDELEYHVIGLNGEGFIGIYREEQLKKKMSGGGRSKSASIGDNVNINDDKSLVNGKSGVITGDEGKHWMVKTLDGTGLVRKGKVEVVDNYDGGGRLKSGLVRDRKYKSEQSHEQVYKRKTKPKNPKYNSRNKK